MIRFVLSEKVDFDFMVTPHHTDRLYAERRHTDRHHTESVWNRIYPKKRRHTDQIFFPAQSVYGRIFP